MLQQQHHQLFAFLSAALECSGTFAVTTDVTVLRSLFTQHDAKYQSKRYSMQASHNELLSQIL